jgi:hypothetical protein
MPYNHTDVELKTTSDTVAIQTPFGRVLVSLGEGDYLVADISGDSRVFVQDAEVYDPELGYV